MAETRKDKRAPISLKVRFKSATLDEFIEQYSADISRGGIFIKSKKPMAVGTLLKFEFQLKDESRLIHGVGRVVWRRETSKGKDMPPGMGIKFIKMDPESRSLVQRIVAERGSAEGRFEQGPDGPEQDASPFFPSTTPAAELPSPEDRTQVRHASEFLASALADSKVDSSAAKEAEKKAEEARKRTEQIEKERAKKRKEAAERAKQMARGEAEKKKALAKGIEDKDEDEDEEAKPEPKKPEATKPEATKAELKKPEPPKKPEATKPELKKPEPPKKPEAAKPEAKKPEAAKPELRKPEPKRDAPPVFDEDAATQLHPSSEALAALEREALKANLDAEEGEDGDKKDAGKKAVVAAPEPEKKAEPKKAEPEAKKAEPKKAEPKKAEPKPVEKPAAKAKPADDDERPAWMMPAIGVAIAAVALIGFFVLRGNGSNTDETTNAGNPPVENVGTEGEGAEGEGLEGEGLEGEGAEGLAVEGEGAEGEGAEGEGAEGEGAEGAAAAEVRFRVVSTPAGATISVDGNEVGTAPTQVTGTVGQEMQIVATLAGHSAASQRLTPTAGQAEQRLRLTPLPYHVNITTDPAGAEVRVENETVTSPGRVTLSSPPSRSVSISARLDGYNTGRERVEVSDFHQDGEAMVASVSISLSRASSGGSSGSSGSGSRGGSSSGGSSSGGSSASAGGSSSGGSSSGGSSSGGSSSGGTTGATPPENPF